MGHIVPHKRRHCQSARAGAKETEYAPRVLRAFRLIAALFTARSRALVYAATILRIAERLLWAAAALGLAHDLTMTWIAGCSAAALWAIKGALRQIALADVRQKLTLAVVTAPLAADPADFGRLPVEQAEAALFEGRYAAEQLLLSQIPALIGDAVACVLLFALVGPMNQMVTFGLLGAGTAAVGFALTRRRAMKRLDHAWQLFLGVVDGMLTCVHGGLELKASGRDDELIARMRGEIRAWTVATNRAERFVAAVERLPLAAVVIGGVVVLGRAEPGSFRLADAIRLLVFLPPIAAVMHGALAITSNAPKLAALTPLLELARTGPRTGTGSPPPPLPCPIRFENVTFAYAGRNAPALSDLSLTWAPGRVLALAGPNGSGKSTVLKLLIGLLVPERGRILIGDRELPLLDLRALRRQIVLLPQRPYLADRETVRHAMLLTAPERTDDESKAALEAIDVWRRLVERSPGDPLGAKVGTLSAGERQRVGIARAFAHDVPIVLLDEPDENLDKEGRDLLVTLVRERAKRSMVALVAHSEPLLALADVTLELRAFRPAS
jgi:ABC-type transport system involved in cytochrome bd biosynthesis fused ATPase/permease subunit